jgi:hypothetical protein
MGGGGDAADDVAELLLLPEGVLDDAGDDAAHSCASQPKRGGSSGVVSSSTRAPCLSDGLRNSLEKDAAAFVAQAATSGGSTAQDQTASVRAPREHTARVAVGRLPRGVTASRVFPGKGGGRGL